MDTIDVDECQFEICGLGFKCNNINGGYNCQCQLGYEKVSSNKHNSSYECIDINECSDTYACGPNAKCINLPGSFKCFCPQGFYGQGDLYCES